MNYFNSKKAVMLSGLSLTLVAALASAGPQAAKTSDADKGKTKPEEKAWDIEAAVEGEKAISFTTDEGTWIDLDVSPDGKTIVFSMLGDIYTMPITGGTATVISKGKAWDVQPRFSSDGKEIAFTSDRGGGNNLWRMKSDGSEPFQISKEDFRLMNSPSFSPDGRFVVGKKHFTSQRSLGAGELWLYHRDGGAGLQLTTKKNDQQDLGEATFSADGRYIYFSEDVSPGPNFQYNKSAHGLIYATKRLDRETGKVETIVSAPGGAVSPQPSPDGKRLAYVKRVRDKSVLHVLDLKSGQTKALWDGLTHDQQEAWAIFGPYTKFDWTPDSSAMVIWAQGKIWKVDANSGKVSNIPFSATVEQSLLPALRFTQQLDGEQFEAKMIRDAATSPDGKTLVFHAVGQLWRKQLPSGKPTSLVSTPGQFQYQPSFSADGRSLLFTTWNDETLGAIWSMDVRSGRIKKISAEPGFYYSPRFSPDAKSVVYSRFSGNGLTGSLWSSERGVYTISANGGKAQQIVDNGVEPQFSADGSRVYYFTGGGVSKKLMSAGLHGEDPREVFNLKYVDFVSISPDGRNVAFTELFNAYVAPLPTTGNSIELSKDIKSLPITRLSEDVGSYLHWSDAQTLHWMVGNQYVSRKLGAEKDDGGVAVGLTVKTDKPEDVFAFIGARIITMRDAEKSQEVIEDGVLIVSGNSIIAVGANGSVSIPANARRIDAKGKTIFPGIIDAHAHAAHFSTGVIPQQNWAYYANLAFGVTTMHDPSATTETVFSQAELQKQGSLVGPRVFSTGTILYGAEGDFKAVVNSLDDARKHLRRMKANGAFSVKSYNQPRRNQRQQINQAARELGMLVVEEGGSTFNHNMTMIVDGATGVEHNIPVAPLYRDVQEMWRQTDVRNTPTFVVNYGGVSGEYWWYARDNVWENERLLKFFPRETLDARSIRRETAPDWDYWHIEVAKAAKVLRDQGVKFQVGGHGQLQGLAPHWETWMFTQGGFSNFEALRAATIDGADYLGLSSDLGSIEVGKRADLVVVNGNPLQQIRDTANTHMVMVDGRLFDASDMSEIGGKQRKAPVFFWQRHPSGQSFGIQYGPTAPCHCPKGAQHNH